MLFAVINGLYGRHATPGVFVKVNFRKRMGLRQAIEVCVASFLKPPQFAHGAAALTDFQTCNPSKPYNVLRSSVPIALTVKKV